MGHVGERCFQCENEEVSPDDWAYRTLIDYNYDGNDKNTGRLTFEFYQGNELAKIDGNAVEDIVLEFTQDGEDDDEDFHYTYTNMTIYFGNGDKKDLKPRPLPSKSLIGAAEKIFRQIVRMADK